MRGAVVTATAESKASSAAVVNPKGNKQSTLSIIACTKKQIDDLLTIRFIIGMKLRQSKLLVRYPHGTSLIAKTRSDKIFSNHCLPKFVFFSYDD